MTATCAGAKLVVLESGWTGPSEAFLSSGSTRARLADLRQRKSSHVRDPALLNQRQRLR